MVLNNFLEYCFTYSKGHFHRKGYIIHPKSCQTPHSSSLLYSIQPLLRISRLHLNLRISIIEYFCVFKRNGCILLIASPLKSLCLFFRIDYFDFLRRSSLNNASVHVRNVTSAIGRGSAVPIPVVCSVYAR